MLTKEHKEWAKEAKVFQWAYPTSLGKRNF